MEKLNLIKNQTINILLNINVEGEKYGEFFGKITYMLGENAKIKIITKRNKEGDTLLKKISNTYFEIKGQTDYGVYYCFDCYLGKTIRTPFFIEFDCISPVSCFIDKVGKIINETFSPSIIESFEDTSFTICRFEIEGINYFLSQCVNLIKREHFEIPLSKDKKLDIKKQEKTSVSLVMDENKRHYFCFEIDFKKRTSMRTMIDEALKIKDILSFFSNSKKLFIKKISLYKDVQCNEQLNYQERCWILLCQDNYLSQENDLNSYKCIFFHRYDEFQSSLKQLYTLYNNNLKILFSLLHYNWKYEDLFISIVTMIKAIDKNYSFLCTCENEKKIKKEEIKKLQGLIDGSNIEEQYKEKLKNQIGNFTELSIKQKISIILKTVKSHNLIVWSPEDDKIINVLTKIRHRESHGNSFHYGQYSLTEHEEHQEYRAIIFASVYIQIMKKIGLSDSTIKNFCTFDFRTFLNNI